MPMHLVLITFVQVEPNGFTVKGNMIERLVIEGFKSIRNQQIMLGKLNVLIGPNASGKSNLIGFLRMLGAMANRQLERYVFHSGGIDALLFGGQEVTPVMHFEVRLQNPKTPALVNCWKASLEAAGDHYRVENEWYGFHDQKRYADPYWEPVLQNGTRTESALPDITDSKARYTLDRLAAFRVYHFHDTSDNAPVKRPADFEDVSELKPEAENLAAVLYLLKQKYPAVYRDIRTHVQLIYNQFDDFVLEESPRAKGKLVLQWREKGSNYVFGPRQISDGTLRFISLATLLLQPPPDEAPGLVPHTVILDEPELGLHPLAITVLAEMLQKAALDRQLVVATQSATLLDHFGPEEVLVTERRFVPEVELAETVFRRLDEQALASWLEDYELGQLWEKNLFGGRP